MVSNDANTAVANTQDTGKGDKNTPYQGTLRLSGKNFQGTDTGKRTPGGNPIIKYNSNAGYSNIFNTSDIGKLIKSNSNEAVKYGQRLGFTHSYDNNSKSHLFLKGDEFVRIYDSGGFDAEGDQNTINSFFGKSAASQASKSSQETDETIDIKVGPQGKEANYHN